MTDERMLTVSEVAALRRMTRGGLAAERYRRQGPPYVRTGHRTVLYPADDLHRWLDDRRSLPGGQTPTR